MEKRNSNLLGIILILVGIAVFLLNTEIFSGDMFLILVGLTFLAIYFNRKYTWSLISGLVITVVGITAVIDELFPLQIDLAGFTLLFGLGIAFLILYYTKKIMGFVFPGFILPSIGIFSLVSSIYTGEISWAFFLLLGLSFYGIYLAEFMKRGYRWPLIPGTILIGFSAIVYLITNDIIKASVWKIVSYFWPAILIIIGIKIIFDNARHRTK